MKQHLPAFLKPKKLILCNPAVYIVTVLIALAFNTSAQNPDLKFTALTNKQGLIGNAINIIVKDNDGFMWLGTTEGLSKYDGKQFTVYHVGDKGRQGATEISSIYKDEKGVLWVGTLGHGLFFYDRANDVFTHFVSKIKGQRLSHGIVTAVCADARGMLWVGTVNGLDVVDPVNKTIRHMETGADKPGAIPIRTIHNIFRDNRQRMWVGTPAGLYLYNQVQHQFIALRHRADDATSLVADGVTSIAQDKAGHMWIGTANGLSRLKDDGLHFVNYRYNDKDEYSLCGDIVYSIAADDKDHIWVGTEGGLNVMDVNTGRAVRYRHDPRNPYSLNSKSIRSIYIDKDGTYWVGTYMGGLNKYDKNLTLFNYVQSSEVDLYGLNAPLVAAFAQKNADEIYVGTDGGGLSVFNTKTNRFSHIAISPKERINSVNLPILTMDLDRRNRLWIGTFEHGLIRLNTNDNSYVQYTSGPGKKELSQNNIFCLKADRTGKIWIGTNGAGVNILDPSADTIQKGLPVNPKSKGVLQPGIGFIRAFEEDDEGNMWIGAYGTGITVYHPATKSFDIHSNFNTGLPIMNVISLKKDSKGKMWIGTTADGLFCYDPKLKKFSAYQNNKQLPNGNICKILEDQAGNIWVSTNQGICRIDQGSQKLHAYAQCNGLQNNVFMNGSGIVTSNGTIYFGGVNGFNYFRNTDVRQNKNLPPVTLTALSVDNKRIAPANDNPLPVNISQTRQIVIKYGQDFSISFVALNYTLPHQNQYAYILEGFNKSWKYVGSATTANYTNIDPGEYTFRVKAANNDGRWNNVGTSLKIIVKPPFWMTTTAYLLYTALALAALWLIRRQGVKKLRRKMQEEQELKDAEARHELDMLKIKFLTNLSHEFRTPISLIMAPVDKLLTQQHGQPVAEQLGVIKRNARRLLNLVNQLLDFRKLEENELKLNMNDGELISFVKEVTDSFHDLAESKKIKTSFKSAVQQLYVKFDFDKLERVLFNLLSNAFKFSKPGGQVLLELAEPVLIPGQNAYLITLMVKDTGTGIAADQLAHIFDRFYQADAPSSILNQGSGIGLSITRELVQLHGGEITAESEPGKGSAFTFTLTVPAVNVPTLHTPVADTMQTACVAETKAAPALSPGINRPHILIIEDNDEMRHYLADNLGANFKVSEAANGREGWHKALSLHPDLVVSDISMPYMDGIQLSRKLKTDKRTSHIPIILLTAMTSQQEQLAGLELGVNDYLTKPFNFEILNIKIKNLLRLNKELKETYQKKIKMVPGDTNIESSSEKFIKDVVAYVEKNMNHPKFSVEEISHHFSMSRGSFYSKITELTGEPPVEFIRSIKLDKAAILLEKTDLTIAEIAYSIGFSTPHYFTKSFKVKYNVLPSEYRNKKLSIKDLVEVW